MRAATPSQGAEIAVPLDSEMEGNIRDISRMLDIDIQNRLKNCRLEIQNAQRILKIHSPISRIANSYLEVDKLQERLNFALKTKISREKNKIEGLNNLLTAYNPIKVISKGYAIIEDEEEHLIVSKEQLSENKKIKISLRDGEVRGDFIPQK